MSIAFYVAGHLTAFTGGESNLTLNTTPATVREALDDLWKAYPGLRDRVVTEQGRVRPHVIVFIGNDDIRSLDRLETTVGNGIEISILPAVSGGGPSTQPKGHKNMEKKLVVTHVEWSTPEPEQLSSFLSELFGWKFGAFGEDYFMYNPENAVSIGILRNTQAQPGGTPNVYISVESIDVVTANALKLGGQIAVPKTEIPGMGWFAFVSSPEKNLIGLHESI